MIETENPDINDVAFGFLLGKAALGQASYLEIENLFLAAMNRGPDRFIGDSSMVALNQSLTAIYKKIPATDRVKLQLTLGNKVLNWSLSGLHSWHVDFLAATFGVLWTERFDVEKHFPYLGLQFGVFATGTTILKLDFRDRPDLQDYRAEVEDEDAERRGKFVTDPLGLYRRGPQGPEIILFMAKIQQLHRDKRWPGTFVDLARVVFFHELAHRFHLAGVDLEGRYHHWWSREWGELVAQFATMHGVEDNSVQLQLFRKLSAVCDPVYQTWQLFTDCPREDMKDYLCALKRGEPFSPSAFLIKFGEMSKRAAGASVVPWSGPVGDAMVGHVEIPDFAE